MSESLIFTANAAAKVWELIQEEGNFNLKLRAYVTGGGCSGFQYGFKFDETVNDDDTIVTQIVKENTLPSAASLAGDSQLSAAPNKPSITPPAKDSQASEKRGESETAIPPNNSKHAADSNQNTTDSLTHTVQLLVDPISYQYLAGAEIDYKEDLEGAQFIIRNPNAKTTCGCGSSFST